MSDVSEMDFKLERYKFINAQIDRLNKNTHIYLTQFQTITVSIIGASVLIFVNFKSLNVIKEVASYGIKSLYFLLIGVSIFTIARIVAGVFSWYDYRKEENKLLDSAVEIGFRSEPNISSFWRWDEFYTMLIVVFVPIAFAVFSEMVIIPLIMTI